MILSYMFYYIFRIFDGSGAEKKAGIMLPLFQRKQEKKSKNDGLE
jgi:hypothetical protein